MKTLNLFRRRLGDIEMLVLSEFIKKMSTLESLILSHNEIGDRGLAAICEVLDTNSTITNLELSANKISNDGAINLVNRLNRNSTLSFLSLVGNNHITASYKTEVSKIWKSKTSYKRLRINWSVSMLSFHEGKTEVDYNDRAYNDDDIIVIASGLKINYQLTSLILSNNQFTDAGAQAIGEALERNTVLTSLNLTHNSEIGKNGCQLLARIILKSNTIKDFSGILVQDLKQGNFKDKTIELPDMGCGDVEAFVLGALLEINTTVETLDLSNNNISKLGAIAIIEKLHEKSSLFLISLMDNNKITDEDKTEINNLWKRNAGSNKWPINWKLDFKYVSNRKQRDTFDLQDQGFNDDDAAIIGCSFKTSTSITKIYLSSNKFGDKGIQRLVEGLKYNSMVRELDLHTNVIGDVGAQYIANLLVPVTKDIILQPGPIGMTFNGNIIFKIGHQSQAEKLGVPVGWTIHEVNDERQPNNQDSIVKAIFKTHKKNKNTRIKLKRGQLKLVTFKDGPLGIDLTGNVVTGVTKNGQAEIKGITEGWTVFQINDEPQTDNQNEILEQIGNVKKSGKPLEINFHLAEQSVQSGLAILNLSINEIGDEGTKSLCEVLKKNTTLSKLALDFNNIGDSGAESISELLKENTILQLIRLTNNKIGDKGVKLIAEALSTNTRIEYIYMKDNPISKETSSNLEDERLFKMDYY